MDAPNNNASAHHSTVELANCRIQLRADLSFHLQEYQGAPCYLIEDDFNSRFFRIGLAEYQLISLLNGSTTISQAVSKSASQMGDQAISEQDAVTICKWLIDTGLATTDASRSSGRLLEAHDKSDRKKRLAKLNPVTPKFSLFNPDAWLTQLNHVVGWCFSFPMFIGWCIVVAMALYQVASNWDLVAGSQSMVFSRDNWIWLGLTWLGLKLVHETAHGIVCKRFGGDVRQCGVVLIVMIPLPFVDVTSSWRFPSKWQRIFVAAAGMYVELFLAAIAAIVWSYSEVGLVRQQAFNVMLAGSVTTLLFNANPLMRFDGYYMLSDWLEMPNLGSHAQQWIKWVGKRFYLGLDVKKPSWPEGREAIVAAYSILALFWKVMICVGLAIAAETLFFGAGIVLAFLAIVMWVVWPIGKLLKFVMIGEATLQRPSRIRFCLLSAAIALGGWTFCTQTPWYGRVNAAALVDYRESSEVRTPVGGFLVEILVVSDQPVEAGELLARLGNPELRADVRKLEIQLEQIDLRMRQIRDQQQMAQYDVELKNREAVQERLSEQTEQLGKLEVRAPVSGIVVADELESQLGTYLAPGHKLCDIETDSQKEIYAMIPQQDFDVFAAKLGEPVDVHVWGTGPGYFPAKLDHLNPRGRLDLPHPAFSASAGGPLPVQYRPASSAESGEEQNSIQLVRPHFLARFQMTPERSLQFKSGQPAIVSIRTSRGTIGDVLVERVTRWIRTMRKMNQASH